MRNSFVGVDLRALQAFVAVCETRSMTEAARVLGVTQSAVSQLIAALEREQGVALFDREFRPVRPNAAASYTVEILVDGTVKTRVTIDAKSQLNNDYYLAAVALAEIE